MKPHSVALFIVALTCTACHKWPFSSAPAQQTDEPRTLDYELRTFLGIRTVRGKFTLPDSAAGYYPVAILFADGQEIARKKCQMLSSQGSALAPRKVEIQLLCQSDGSTFRRAALVDGHNQTDLAADYPYWNEFTSAAWRSIGPDDHLHYQGITILGLMASNGSHSKVGPALYMGNDDKLATSNKYVVAIGVDYDDDATKLRERFLSSVAK